MSNITKQEAAALLNVPETYVDSLLQEGKLTYFVSGKFTWLKVQEVKDFKQQRDKDRREALKELARITQEFGGYGDED